MLLKHSKLSVTLPDSIFKLRMGLACALTSVLDFENISTIHILAVGSQNLRTTVFTRSSIQTILKKGMVAEHHKQTETDCPCKNQPVAELIYFSTEIYKLPEDLCCLKYQFCRRRQY